MKCICSIIKFSLDHNIRQTKDYSEKINFKDKLQVIGKIEKDFLENEILKENETVINNENNSEFPKKFDYKNDLNSSVLQNRKKKKDSFKFDEQLSKIRKKKKLLDFIMVIFDLMKLQRTKNKYFLESEGINI